MKSMKSLILLAISQLLATTASAQESLPKVVLIGDSIRMGYAGHVAKALKEKAIIVSSPNNGGDSSNVLKSLETLAIKEQPAVVHFNCGIHDFKKFKKNGTFQVPPEKYEANLRAIVKRLREETKAVVIFATITPIIDDRAANARKDKDYELLDASSQRYNQIARKVMEELKVPINDLNAAVNDDKAKLMVGDGTHFTGDGSARLAAKVVEAVSTHLPKR